MRKNTLVVACVTLLLVAAVAFVSNIDMFFGGEDITEKTEEQTVQNAENKVEETVKNTVAPTTVKPTETTVTKPTTEYKPAVTNPQYKAENITGAPDSSAKTFTGYAALPSVTFAVNDPENSRGLPISAINHSFGVAKDGKPHDISVNSQKFFETKGYNAVTYDTKSTEKVLYLTFDCGYENGYTFKVLDTLKEKNVSAAFFCTLDHIKAEPELISRMIKEGHIVGNHSDKHPNFSKINRTRMAQEIETTDNYLRANFGYTSPFFRFPEGAYSENALDLVGSLGYKSVFWSLAYSDWDTSNQKGKQYAFDTVTARLHPGAIILLHSVSKDNAEALGDIIDYALTQGYVFKPLTELPL